MPSTKIFDREPNRIFRRSGLYALFSENKLLITSLSDGVAIKDETEHGAVMYYAKTDENTLDLLFSQTIRDNFLARGYELIEPPEINALKSVIIRNIDKQQVENYDKDELIIDIEAANEGLRVLDLVILPTKTKMIKIKFENQNMALWTIENGLKIVDQFLPPASIEREVYIRISPCYNCYAYDHYTKNCPKQKLTLCAKCAGNNHRNDSCNSTSIKCINCGEQHHTLAAKCAIRKTKLKN